MKCKVILLFSLMALFLSGCDTSRTDAKLITNPSYHSTTIPLRSIPTKGPGAYDADVEEFNLGRLEYTASSGKVMPFQLRGIMGIPKGSGSFPLVLITHGSYENKDASKRFDTGFEYLVEKLAKNGYIAISMDMTSAYLLKYGDKDYKEKSVHIADKQLEKLRLANDGQEIGYPINISGKIDFSHIGLCGHSQGGDAIFDITLDQKEKGQDIKALLPIAPTLSNSEEAENWPNTAISTLVPEFYGAESSLDEFAIDATLARKITALHYMTILKKATANYFNANVDHNDTTLNYPEDNLPEQLNPTEQQIFLSHFAVDFYNASLKGKTEETLYAADKPAPNQMYNHDVTCCISENGDATLLDTSMKDQINTTGCEVSILNDAPPKRGLFNIRWEKLGATLSFSPDNVEFRKQHVLSLRLVTDPADGLNENLKGQSLTVTLVDGTGNESSVTLEDCPNSLALTPGNLEPPPSLSHATPIMNTDIPLSAFKGVALDNIVTVTVSFDQTDSGGVLLERILLQNRGNMEK